MNATQKESVVFILYEYETVSTGPQNNEMMINDKVNRISINE